MTLNDVVAVVLLGPLIVALVVGMFSLMFFDGAMPHPFTAVGRARIRRRAEVELEREAETAERELRRLGVDL
jgi:hypothetical protein